MFTQSQHSILRQELDASRIKTRSKGNVDLSYLEGFDIIDTANRIFGYGNWSYEITSLEEVSQEPNANANTVVCYKAVVRVTVWEEEHVASIHREDVGFGTGIAKMLSDAHEGGAKEAVTDAIKRALRSFGAQFGNSLYDKSKHHHTQTQPSNHTRPFIPQEHTKLTNLGLTVMEQGQNLVVIGEDIFSKRDTIKACGFKWDGISRLWYKPKEQQAA